MREYVFIMTEESILQTNIDIWGAAFNTVYFKDYGWDRLAASFGLEADKPFIYSQGYGKNIGYNFHLMGADFCISIWFEYYTLDFLKDNSVISNGILKRPGDYPTTDFKSYPISNITK